MSEPIKIEDLTPGTVVQPKPVKILSIERHGAINGEVDGRLVFLDLFHIEAIVETPEAKIARLEAELVGEAGRA